MSFWRRVWAVFWPSAAQQAAAKIKDDFERNAGWVMGVFGLVFANCGIASGLATFVGIRMYLEETGDIGAMVDGLSVILTISIMAILITGWSFICKYGSEVQKLRSKLAMAMLGAVFFGLTISVSSLPNLMALTGPAAKQHDWRLTHAELSMTVNALQGRALGVMNIRPGWVAEMNRTCGLRDKEVAGGTVSESGSGVGPVAVALDGICEQTKTFVEAIDDAVERTELATAKARAALSLMRKITRDREGAIINREDQFLVSGDLLMAALQEVRSADLSDALDAGAAQVAASIGELREDSSFTAKQVEMVSSIKDGLTGLVEGTKIVSERLREIPLPEIKPVRSPDFIEAILTYAPRFVPVFAAAIALDAFMIWALFFLIVARSDKT